ncbi:hypothetical protein SKAU_G00374670 [Synaphobranchus kaupii]|uniref:Uncharacterized protein n=1 Tax=Synaphobranchus kaupii TaxID=118154 RepID=A0A9Q1EGR1_SYNKA|nr:hypothetical protein SKAU_G00374670 [Synaphobranchus kaupii]
MVALRSRPTLHCTRTSPNAGGAPVENNEKRQSLSMGSQQGATGHCSSSPILSNLAINAAVLLVRYEPSGNETPAGGFLRCTDSRRAALSCPRFSGAIIPPPSQPRFSALTPTLLG